MKKLLFFAPVALILFALAPQVFAQGFTALAPITGLTDPSATSVVNSGSFASFFNNLYKYTIGLSAALAVIMIIWGGLEISTKDSVSKQSDGKERITQAIYGLILVLAPVLVFSIINPSILRLDIGIKPLNTVTGAAIPAPSLTTGYTLSTTEVADRPAGTNVLFSFEVDPNISPSAVIQVLNVKQSECTDATGGPGIILPASLQTTLRRFVCQTCESGRTATPSLTCGRQNTTYVCGSCN